MLIGLIPASGSASRFHGCIKELLPIKEKYGETITLLENTIFTLKDMGCQSFVITSTSEKINAHIRATKKLGLPITWVIGGETMWDSILIADRQISIHDKVLMAMPDTLTKPIKNFNSSTQADFSFGTFISNTPEKFSAIWGHEILTKNKRIIGPAPCWGMVYWNRQTINFNMYGFTDYDKCFESCWDSTRNNSTFELEYYYDFADFEAYKTYLKEN